MGFRPWDQLSQELYFFKTFILAVLVFMAVCMGFSLVAAVGTTIVGHVLLIVVASFVERWF